MKNIVHGPEKGLRASPVLSLSSERDRKTAGGRYKSGRTEIELVSLCHDLS